MSKFDPENVMLYEKIAGEIPSEYNKLVLEEVMQNSKVMQLAKYEEMKGKEKSFEYFAEGPGAYWVGEGEKIETTKAKMLQVKMEAKKLATIVVVSREYLNYKMSDFFTEMQSKIAEALYKKFDEAAILGVDNPFAQSIQKSVTTTDKIIKNAINYDSILELGDLVLEEDIEPNAFISKAQNRSALRGAIKTENGVAISLFDKSNNTIDGLPAVNLKSAEMEKGTLFTGDFDHMRYGIPFNIKYSISEEAQLSTIKNPDNSPVNLFEQELIAMRVTMDVGLMIIKDEAFAKLEAPAGV
ncbi:TPA_asm: phage major capsid protein [Listeria monocytogenes]|uniref:phage major capsid protein n=1 Tax=Listeria monocytogenes TaxID=1639 RepID=UPI000BE063AF|nr:phage major capsid protein [Listeria monocytogenes]EAE4828474.1 phage major capsid protein [Listeria monocytogenes]EHP7829777.1 phage major capsid protein [Listeria monocytogenes]PDA36710.1 phage major capsid protein [Listeria monocytogenes]PDA49138.1 phage major capsid protein [Listeria monocytogenes]PDA71086.1 phage major capsid protein [Listeria monocytogenes]